MSATIPILSQHHGCKEPKSFVYVPKDDISATDEFSSGLRPYSTQ
jgi:hypothetical protein